MNNSLNIFFNLLLFISGMYFVFFIPISIMSMPKINELEDAMALNRQELDEKDCWDISKIYPSLDIWYDNLKKTKESKDWQKLVAYKEKLNDSADTLKNALIIYFELMRSIENLYVYSHLYLDEDLGNDKAKEVNGLAQSLFFYFQETTSWIEPEILQIPEARLKTYINDPSLKDFKFYLERLSRLKNHTLNVSEEQLIARATQAFQTPSSTFSVFENADLTFDKIKDASNNTLDLTHGKYTSYMREPDRVLRKNAYETYHKQFLAFENTLCELLQGQMKVHSFVAKTRKFKSCLEAALYPNQIDLNVYHNLIKAVRTNIKTLHKFVSFKKRILHLDKFYPYDIYAPLASKIDFKMDAKKAKETIVNSVTPLGEEYKNILKKGLYEDRWVDFFETNKKRSGAYSSGSYDTMPYILMNFYGNLNDVNTLAHEAGHSMHSYFSNKNQSYVYAQYPIFLAEVASTFNEQLLQDYLMKTTTDEKQKAFLLAEALDRMQATFFRQTLFAEFELKIHELVENNVPLTPKKLKDIYHQLYVDYYGKDMEVDDSIDIEWGRVPHFYYNFYVYQYATSICAAVYLFKLVKNDKNVSQQYLKFLKSGGIQYPLETLKQAGVDLTKPDAIQALINDFNSQIDELSKILEKK